MRTIFYAAGVVMSLMSIAPAIERDYRAVCVMLIISWICYLFGELFDSVTDIS